MKYNLSASGFWFTITEKKALEKLGFKFSLEDYLTNDCWVVSNIPTIEINTLEELTKIIKKYPQIRMTKNNIHLCG